MIRIRRVRANNFKHLRGIDLLLPPHGRFLIEGKNEAGKSTFFEAVYFGIFGRGLVMEGRRLDSLIGYGAKEAYVEIWLDAPGREVRIRRTIARERANTWELEIRIPGRSPEEVRGNRVVNERIVDELGFDGDALLNTTFVEQKKLDKLEGMSRSQREQSLMKLLNLERMTRMIDHFRVKAEDQRLLERLQERFELAQVQKDLPERVADLRKTEETLLRISLRRTLEEIREIRNTVDALHREVEVLEQEAEQWRKKARYLERLGNIRQRLELLRRDYDKISELHKQAQEIEGRIARLDQIEAEVIPQLERKREALLHLKGRLQALEAREEDRTRLEEKADRLKRQMTEIQTTKERLATLQKEVQGLETQLQEAQGRLRQVEELLQDQRVHKALEDWLIAREALEAPAQKERALAEEREKQQTLRRRLRREVVVLAGGTLISMAAAGAAVLSRALPPVIVGVMSLVVIAVLGYRLVRLLREAAAVSSKISGLEAEQRVYRSQIEQHQEALQRAEERLQSLDVSVPENVETAHMFLKELGERLAQFDASDLEAEVDNMRIRVARLQGQRDERLKTVKTLEAELASVDVSEIEKEREHLQDQVKVLEHEIRELRSHIQQEAAGAGLEPSKENVQTELGKIEAELQNAQKQVEERNAYIIKLERLRHERETLWREIRERYTALRQEHEQIPIWDDEDAEGTLAGAYGVVEREIAPLEGEDPRGNLEQTQRKLGTKRGEMKTHEQQLRARVKDARILLDKWGRPGVLPEPIEDEHIERLYQMVQDAPLEQDAMWAQRRDDLLKEIEVLRKTKERLEERLGLQGEQIDLEQARREFEEKRRELQVREKAVEIVRTAQRRVVEKIMPATMEQMRALLPVLTMERYFDAELTDDYHIRVWDERAGDWKQKNIFSGGTKDQFSLALRLAFALATLPEERGSAPSFIFLDEPLSSFDKERARALLHLLTEGEIARSFDQIFLTTHVPVDTSLFNYHIVMDEGRIVEHDLP